MAQVGGEEYGPFTWDQMLQMAAEGRVTPELPIRKASDSRWSTVADIPGLLGGPKPAAPAPKPASRPAVPSAASMPAGKSTVKKAKPLARPPTGRPVPPVVTTPQNIPAGIPVGAPAGTTVAPPPVAAAPASGAFNIDLASSPGKPRSVKKSALDDDDEDDVIIKKKSSTPLILGVLGGVTALVAVSVGLTIYITLFRGGKEEQLVTTNASAETKAAKVKKGESNPGEAIAEGEADTGANKPASAKGDANANMLDAQPKLEADKKLAQTAISSVPKDRWVNVATSSRFGIGNANVEISRVWLSNQNAEQSSKVPEGSQKYLAVELVISNKAGATLKYKGWNNPGKTPVFLTDEKDQLYKLLPLASTPGIPRLTKTDIQGGGRVTEVLIFEAPSDSFEELKLLLPQSVFYPKTKNPYFGIAITSDVIADGGGPRVAAPPAGIASGDASDPLLSGRRVSTDPALPESPAETTKPVPQAAAKADAPPPKKPSLIDEINKSVDEDDKGKKMDEGKGADVEKKPEPAKKGEPAKKLEPAKKTAPAKGKK